MIKRMTIYQRLRTTLGLLILLLMLGFLAALRIEQARAQAESQNMQLADAEDRLLANVYLMNSSLRGVLLNPKDDPERTRRQDAEADLSVVMNSLQKQFADQPDLMRSLQTLRYFTQTKLIPFNRQSIDLLPPNAAAAAADYNRDFPAIRDQRDRLFDDLAKKIGSVKEAEAVHAQTVSLVGAGCIVVILLASLYVTSMQSAAVTGPLSHLAGSLERMRSGDFTERVTLDRADEFGVLGEGLNRLADDLSGLVGQVQDRKSTRLNSSHQIISYAVFSLKTKTYT